MSSLVNDKVISVISTKPKSRRTKDIESLIPWFTGINSLFKNLSKDVMRDIIRNCKFKQVEIDQVIIKQGEIGNSFYIMLSGEVSVYIKDLGEDPPQETEVSQETLDKKIEKKSVQFSQQNEILNYESESEEDFLDGVGFLYNTLEYVALDRIPFGVFIKALGAGVSFGELALINPNCIRNASIIADSDCDLLVVDRDLYSRSLKRAQEQELKDKSDFVNSFPLFRQWRHKYKDAIAQSLKPVSYQFNNTIVNQGDELTGLYFVRKGAAKVSIDPGAYQQQYSSLLEKPSNPDELVIRKDKEPGKKQPETSLLRKERQKNLSAKVFDVSLIGKNDIIGDAEVILDIGTCLQTVTCTTSFVEVYELELKNVERLLTNRKNPQMPKTQTALLKIVESKLQLRFKSIQMKLNTDALANMTVLNELLEKISDLNRQDRERQYARQKPLENKNEGEDESEKTKFSIYLPERGPLIDAFGPGSLIHMNKKNREKQLRKLRKEQTASESQQEGAGEGFAAEDMEPPSKTVSISEDANKSKIESKLQELLRKTTIFTEAATDEEVEVESDSVYEEVDRELNALESRIKAWYGEIYESYTPVNTALAPSSPSLKRVQLEKKSRVRREISPILKRRHGAQSAPLDDPSRRLGAQSAPLRRPGTESAPLDGRKSVAFAAPPAPSAASRYSKGSRRKKNRYQYTAEEYKELKEKLKVAEKKRIGFEYQMMKAVKVGGNSSGMENQIAKKTMSRIRPRSSAF